MTAERVIVMFRNLFPLSWPTDAYPLAEEFDPGEIVADFQSATKFKDVAAAREKALQHYNARDVEFRVVLVHL